MKTKQLFLVALMALLGWSGQAWAQSDADHIKDRIFIESIKKTTRNGKAPSLPLSAETTSQIYFDVTLTDISTSDAEKWTFTDNSYNANTGERPYLILNIPFKGMSSKDGVTLATGEAETVETDDAVAWYVGKGKSGNVLRFVYNVRPGDLAEAITWYTTDDGHPLIDGAVEAIGLQVYKNGTVYSQSRAASTDMFQWADTNADGKPDEVPDTGKGRDWPVSGYTLTLGDGGDDLNTGRLYHGLVPFTVTLPADAPEGTTPAASTQNALRNNFAIWAEDNAGTIYNVVATKVVTGNETIKVADPAKANLAAIQGKFAGPGATTAFTAQQFYLDVSQAIASGTALRLCYGVNPGTEDGLFTYVEVEVEATPLTQNQATYQVINTVDLVEGSFALETDPLTTAGVAKGDTVTGGKLVVSAGATTDVFINKNSISDLADYGTIYAVVEQISQSNGANVSWSSRIVRLTTDSKGITLEVTAPEHATDGTTEYRIYVPGLADATKDQPYYLQVKSAPKRETITLSPLADQTLGALMEFHSTGNTDSFRGYQLTVPASDQLRNFAIYPITVEGAEIKEGDTIEISGEKVDAWTLLSSTVLLQTSNISVDTALGEPRMTVTVAAGQTASAPFYVATVNDFYKNYLTGVKVYRGTDEVGTLKGLSFRAATCNGEGTVTGLKDVCSPISIGSDINNRAPTFTATPPATRTGAVNEPMLFTATAVDAPSDYLVVRLTTGDTAAPKVRLYADEAYMVARLGQTAWAAELQKIASRCQVELATLQADIDPVTPGNQPGANRDLSRDGWAKDTSISFTHTYAEAGTLTWTLAVCDHALDWATTATGTVTFTVNQLFQVYPYDQSLATRTGGLGMVQWGGAADGDGSTQNWQYYADYTFSTRPRSGNTLLTLTAVPFLANDARAKDAGGGHLYPDLPVSTTNDSFFYKWSIGKAYVDLVPNGLEESGNQAFTYSPSLNFYRNYIKEGAQTGGQNVPESELWGDISLSVIFSREFDPRDYDDGQAERAKELWPEWKTSEPYLFDLGDYNQDGVPDGWILKVFGETEGRALIEGASLDGVGASEVTSSETTVPNPDAGAEGEDAEIPATTTATLSDRFPGIGWAAMDAHYRTNNNSSSPSGSFALTGLLYDYRTRLRGRDDILTAGTGPLGTSHTPTYLSNGKRVIRVLKEMRNLKNDVVVITGLGVGVPKRGVLKKKDDGTALEGDGAFEWSDFSDYETVTLAGHQIAYAGDYDNQPKDVSVVKNTRDTFDESAVPGAETGSSTGEVAGRKTRAAGYWYLDAPLKDPYGNVDSRWADWRFLLDEDGFAIRAGEHNEADGTEYWCPYAIVNIKTEEVLVLYASWGYEYWGIQADEATYQIIETVEMTDGPASPTYIPKTLSFLEPIIFPFASQEETWRALFRVPLTGIQNSDAAQLREVLTMKGRKGLSLVEIEKNAAGLHEPITLSDASYRRPDFRASVGEMMDDPFYPDPSALDDVIYPSGTRWLERATTSVDQDKDGLPNALEYFFWYYASRLAYGNVYYELVADYRIDPITGLEEKSYRIRESGDGHEYFNVQYDDALWPAITMDGREETNSALWSERESDTTFTMGRAYNGGFDPNKAAGRGNLWNPIPVDTILSAFHPLRQSSNDDPDNDGISTMAEVAIGTNPIDFDSDNDGIPDGWEVKFGTNPTVNDGDENPDGDFFACVTVEKQPEYRPQFTFFYNTDGDRHRTTYYTFTYNIHPTDPNFRAEAAVTDKDIQDYFSAYEIKKSVSALENKWQDEDYMKARGALTQRLADKYYRRVMWDPTTPDVVTWVDASGEECAFSTLVGDKTLIAELPVPQDDLGQDIMADRSFKMLDLDACMQDPRFRPYGANPSDDTLEVTSDDVVAWYNSDASQWITYYRNSNPGLGYNLATWIKGSGTVQLSSGGTAAYDVERVRDTYKKDIAALTNLPPTGEAADVDGYDATLSEKAQGIKLVTYARVTEQVTLRDHEVYEAFGFDPMTGWIDGTMINRTFAARNTMPFTNREEFYSAVFRGKVWGTGWNNSTNPNSDDSNGDGVPDGWAAYVGGYLVDVTGSIPGGSIGQKIQDYSLASDVDNDGLTGAQEFANIGRYVRDNLLTDEELDPDEALTEEDAEALGNVLGGWYRKYLPTDPFNSDTDFDGLWDGDEGSAQLIALGGGCDPTASDTDRDGMPDGWEFRWMVFAKDEKGDPIRGTYNTLAPNPVRADDASYDADRDGLPNYQEYLTGMLRHLRYDLGADMARLYKDRPGNYLDFQKGWASVAELPDVYTATTDLSNGGLVDSPRYARPVVSGGATSLTYKVNPMVQALAEMVETWSTGNPYSYSVARALSRLWNRTLLVPEADSELADIGGAPSVSLGNLHTNIRILDAAFARLTDINPITDEANAFDQSTVLGAIRAIDGALATLESDVVEQKAYGWAQEWFAANGGAAALWKARRDQILNAMTSDTSPQDYREELLGRKKSKSAVIELTDNELDPAFSDGSALANHGVSTDRKVGYEKAVRASAAPFVQEAYRTALRGFNGGLWSVPTVADYEPVVKASVDRLTGYRTIKSLPLDPSDATDSKAYPYYAKFLAPVGYHQVIKPFSERESRAYVLFGQSFADASGSQILVGGNLPRVLNWDITQYNTKEGLVEESVKGIYQDSFITTSPVVADSDLDGMDDYWEVFHGLNPLLGSGNADSDEANYPVPDAHNYALDKVYSSYRSTGLPGLSAETIVAFRRSGIQGSSDFVLNPAEANPFGNPALRSGSVTGYDYYSYPWIAGLPDADPDGDGKTNYEEAIDGSYAAPRLCTDPSPLWFTDPENPNSFVSRFYSLLNPAVLEIGMTDIVLAANEDLAMSYKINRNAGSDLLEAYPGTTDSVLPYEINEGYDTDGDGVPDQIEQANPNVLNGDPQALRSPDRQQVAYFNGNGVMQSHDNTRYGPMTLLTFTLECWVNPDAATAMTPAEQVLIDRPWRFDEEASVPTTGVNADAQIRHNFQLGLEQGANGTFLPFVRYTGTATAVSNGDPTSTGEPQLSSEACSTSGIEPGKWTHLAATYDGKSLRLYVNGAIAAETPSTLPPGNGVISLHASPTDNVTHYSYRSAPLLLGGTPAAGWFAALDSVEPLLDLDEIYSGTYRGFIDEVRVWDGARNGDQISSNYRRELTNEEMLANRLDAFTTRINGNGFYQALNQPALLALFAFDDIPAGAKNADDPNGAGMDTPWERYPGDEMAEDKDGQTLIAGSLLYRRRGLIDAPALDPVQGTRPAVTEVYTSPYALYPKALQSAYYTEPEFQPMAHNIVAHLPLMDVERAYTNLLAGIAFTKGSPRLRQPSGNAANVKPADSVYWTPYGAGLTNTTATVKYAGVHVAGNPYANRYVSTTTFDPVVYWEYAPFTRMPSTDLLILGDVFAKYIAESWNGSPATNPQSAKEDFAAISPLDGFLSWFDRYGDTNMSEGSSWLADYFGAGSTYDSDADGMPNWWETYYTLDSRDATDDNGPHGDPDGDYLTNYAEYMARSNPTVESTLGNGVADFHVPQWNIRGNRTFGLLYTDNDFMEDHFEALYGDTLKVDEHDAWADPDRDGWCNWSESRYIGYGRRSTNPRTTTSPDKAGNIIAEHPQPALAVEVQYTGLASDKTNEQTQIVIHAYSANASDDRPTATFNIPFASNAEENAGDAMDPAEIAMGLLQKGTASGYMTPGYVRAQTVRVVDSMAGKDSTLAVDGNGWLRYYQWSNGTVNHNPWYGSEGITLVDTWLFEEDGSGNLVGATGQPGTMLDDSTKVVVGSVEHETGLITLKLTDTMPSVFAYGYPIGDTTLTVNYEYQPATGAFPRKFTLRDADSGALREGNNRFYAFLDLNGNGVLDPGEPAGAPNDSTVDFGWDKCDRTLQVVLTDTPAPGFVRVPVQSMIATAQQTSTGKGEDEAAVPFVYDPSKKHTLALCQDSDQSGALPAIQVYTEPYDGTKPYLDEDQLAQAFPNGLPTRTPNVAGHTIYKVFLYPEEQGETEDLAALEPYCIGLVTNVYSSFERKASSLEVPAAGAYLYNARSMKVRWTADVRVPTFDLTLWKVKELAGYAAGDQTVQGANDLVAITPVKVFEGKDLPGGASVATTENGQLLYEYDLAHILGTLAKTDSKTYIGDGEYALSMRLKPFNVDPIDLSGSVDEDPAADGNDLKRRFRIVMREAGVERMDSWYPRENSAFFNLEIYYTGTLLSGNAEDDALLAKNGSRVRIEAFNTASFNGRPIVSTDDLMAYDRTLDPATPSAFASAAELATAAYNPYIKIEADKVRDPMADTVTEDGPTTATNEGGTPVRGNGAFWRTKITAQLRGLNDLSEVYLRAYFDVNNNGKWDHWEPWGYLTAGQAAATGNYFDPLAKAPVLSGKNATVTFYIQDVDIDNNKIADVIESTTMGGDKTFLPGETVDNSDITDPSAPKYPETGTDPDSPETPGATWDQDGDGKADDPGVLVDASGNAVSRWFDFEAAAVPVVTDTPQTTIGALWLKQVVYDASNPLRDSDPDGDGMLTWWENYYGLDAQSALGSDGPYMDNDADGLPNYAEFRGRANPNKVSTLGTGTPDAQVPNWNRRGNPTLGMLYTDSDFMAEKWENRMGLSIDANDAAEDPDGDGWTNWSEVRSVLAPDGVRTMPSLKASDTAADSYPRPTLRVVADYFEKNYPGGTLVVQGFSKSTGGFAKDVEFRTPYLGTGVVHTLQDPEIGHLREGKTNFFVYLEVDGETGWNELKEPAGIPDEGDIEIGFDMAETTLHLALTHTAPPGAVRVNVQKVLDTLDNQLAELKKAEEEAAKKEEEEDEDNNNDDDSDSESNPYAGWLINPTTNKEIDPALFPVNDGMRFYLVLTEYENIVGQLPTYNNNVKVYEEIYNTQKPYLTEHDIFTAKPEGLDGTEAENQIGISYKVWLLPENIYNQGNGPSGWSDYNIAVVTNHFAMVDKDNTAMLAPLGGTLKNNGELAFEWKTSVKVPSFNLKIQKTHDGAGVKLEAPITVYEGTTRGISPVAKTEGTGAAQIYRYRYVLPRGVGELGLGDATLFGNGTYHYTLTLKPYAGTAPELSGNFGIALYDSGTEGMVEAGSRQEKVNDSYYLRAKVRYNGVLCTNDDFGKRHIKVEAYRSAAFCGNPLAATSDVLVYDDDATTPEAYRVLNPYVKMTHDMPLTDPKGELAFYSTAFDVELRGLPTADPVYLRAYFDLNLNGARDTWEPWGYAAVGAASLDGYYYDPQGVKPVLEGQDVAVEFYIWDVDADNDKLADSWEWLKSGKPSDDFYGAGKEDATGWCENYVGVGDNANAPVEERWWTILPDSSTKLSEYAIYVTGLKTYGTSSTGATLLSANESVSDLLHTVQPTYAKVLQDSVEDDTIAISIANILDADGNLNLDWTVVAEPATTGGAMLLSAEEPEPVDITEGLAQSANSRAVYAVLAKEKLSDATWTVIAEVPVKGTTAPSLSNTATSLSTESKQWAFFKVVYQPQAGAAAKADNVE